MKKNIGFVSTRFAGTDGVSLEASKWAEVLRADGNKCYWFAGELDRSQKKSYLVPEAHFKHPLNNMISKASFGTNKRLSEGYVKTIYAYKNELKKDLYSFIDKFSIDTIVAQNCLTIPLQIPLGLALTEVVRETGIDTIAHHHDFYWERERFKINSVDDYLLWSFPPDLHNIKHVVINSDAKKELYDRRGIESIIVPNVLDFENPPEIDHESSRRFVEELGLKDNEKMVLQPTRIIERKGIEYAIDLIRGLNNPDLVLVISHEAGDEGMSYKMKIYNNAKEKGIKMIFYSGKIKDPIYKDGDYLDMGMNLWDIYPQAEFVTYPSTYEGFGNALLEAIYFKKPLFVNEYSVFKKDIKPAGLDLIAIDGTLTPEAINAVRNTTMSEQRRRDMVEHNYEVAKRKYSYNVLKNAFSELLH